VSLGGDTGLSPGKINVADRFRQLPSVLADQAWPDS
jgi:hypothetical protein